MYARIIELSNLQLGQLSMAGWTLFIMTDTFPTVLLVFVPLTFYFISLKLKNLYGIIIISKCTLFLASQSCITKLIIGNSHEESAISLNRCNICQLETRSAAETNINCDVHRPRPTMMESEDCGITKKECAIISEKVLIAINNYCNNFVLWAVGGEVFLALINARTRT